MVQWSCTCHYVQDSICHIQQLSVYSFSSVCQKSNQCKILNPTTAANFWDCHHINYGCCFLGNDYTKGYILPHTYDKSVLRTPEAISVFIATNENWLSMLKPAIDDYDDFIAATNYSRDMYVQEY